MKKTLLISMMLFLGLVSNFAYTGGWSYACPYTSEVHQTINCNLPLGTRVFVMVDCSKYGHAGVTGYLANGRSYAVSVSQGVKQEHWIDEITYYENGQWITYNSPWTTFQFDLVNPYGGPNYMPGSCYAHVLLY